jgi:hypothetical protein
MVNPAILGDEYLYSMNSRKAAPWETSPAGDFSNYLFNFIYQSTNLCGNSFYGCAKILNIFLLRFRPHLIYYRETVSSVLGFLWIHVGCGAVTSQCLHINVSP